MSELILGDSLELLIDNRGKNPPFKESGVPVISGMCVRDGILDLSVARHVSADTWARWMPTPTRKFDVVLTSEAPLGRVAQVTTDEPLTLGQRIFGLRGRAGVLDSRFLYYAFQTASVQADLVGRATGTTVVGIRQPALREVRIPAPSFASQRAIAEVLGALDDKIAVNTKLARTADDLASTYVRSNLNLDHSVELHEIAEITMGSSPPGESYNERGEGMVFYQGVRDFGVRYPTKRVWTTSPVRLASTGDILVSVRAPVGQVNEAVAPTCIGRGLAALRSTTRSQATLFYLLRDAADVWAPYEAEGTVFGSINKKQLESLAVPSPIGASSRLEDAVGQLGQVIRSALRENGHLAATRDALLPHLMSGRLRVKDAEAVAESVL